MSYLMLQSNQFTQLAEINAKAINGLNPQITIWNTGNNEGGATDIIRNIMQAVPPLLDTIQKQTGYNILPSLISKDISKK